MLNSFNSIMSAYPSHGYTNSGMVGSPTFGHLFASSDSDWRSYGAAPSHRPVVTTTPPPGLHRVGSMVASIYNGSDTCPVSSFSTFSFDPSDDNLQSSPSGIYGLASPDWPALEQSGAQSLASTAALPSHIRSTKYTGHSVISGSSNPHSRPIQVSPIDSESTGGSNNLLRTTTTSSQFSRAPTSPVGGVQTSNADQYSYRSTLERAPWETVQLREPDSSMNLVSSAFSDSRLSKRRWDSSFGSSSRRIPRERASWENVQYREPDSDYLVHSASSDSSRSASVSSYRSSHSDRIKRSQQNPTTLFERLQTTGRGWISRWTTATASVSGTTRLNLYRRLL